jgi:hypothetical protein
MPDTLKALPLYALALIKHTSLRTTMAVNPDTRVGVISNINIMGVEELALYLYPRLMIVRYVQY